jgi:hypothetical protein
MQTRESPSFGEMLRSFRDDRSLTQAELAWAHLELGEMVQADQVAGEAIRKTRAGQLRLVLVDALRV